MATLKSLPRRFRLTLDDGGTAEVEQIGRGRFTTAFRGVSPTDPLKVWLQVDGDKDASKELLARIEGPHIPYLRHAGELNGKDLYESRYYLPLTAACKTAWAHFKALHRMNEEAWKETQPGYKQQREIRRTVEEFKSKVQESDLPQSLREDVASICDWAGSYGREGYAVEIAKRNLATDYTGALILLDPVFDWAWLEE